MIFKGTSLPVTPVTVVTPSTGEVIVISLFSETTLTSYVIPSAFAGMFSIVFVAVVSLAFTVTVSVLITAPFFEIVML